jgi:hypothetical protein
MIRRILVLALAVATVGFAYGCSSDSSGGLPPVGPGGTPGTDNGTGGFTGQDIPGAPGADPGAVGRTDTNTPGMNDNKDTGGVNPGHDGCSPNCVGRQCGPDGCGGQCGFCTPGNTCTPTGQCEAVQAGEPFGSACTIPAECAPLEPTDFSNQQAVITFLDCLNKQCSGGDCNAFFGMPMCTRTCVLGAESDKVNNTTGAAMPDGVEDSNSPAPLCTGAADGPYGVSFKCVRLTNPNLGQQDYSMCLPGTDFKACNNDTECPTGEACQIQSVMGDTGTFCMTKVKGGKGIGELCQSNPHNPDMFYNTEEAFCESGLCFINGIGCGSMCQSDADCGAWQCKKNMQLGETLFLDVCFPQICEIDVDCTDTSNFCRTFVGGGTCGEDGKCTDKPELACDSEADCTYWENLCLKRPADTVGVGEACDPDPSDNIPGNTCDNPIWCMRGQCSTHCNADSDCATDKQMCGVIEIPIDIDGDDDYTIADAFLPLGVCQPVPPGSPECTKETDCEAGKGCVAIELEKAGGGYEIKSFCAPGASDAATGVHGDICGGTSGVECINGNCLQLFSNQATGEPIGVCLATCTAAADCPQDAMIAGEQQAKGVCRSLQLGFNGTADPRDDLFLAVCLPDSMESSHTPCGSDIKGVATPSACTEEKEVCLGLAIAGNPDEEAKVEFLCLDVSDAQTGEMPAKKVGESCDPTAGDCSTGLCLGDPGKAVCSTYCSPSQEGACAAVPDSACKKMVMFSRVDPDKEAFAFVCQKTNLTCQGCASSRTDCGDGFTCADIATGEGLPDFRCVQSCTADGECGNGTCKDTADQYGVGGKGCMPTTCQ